MYDWRQSPRWWAEEKIRELKRGGASFGWAVWVARDKLKAGRGESAYHSSRGTVIISLSSSNQ